MSSSFEMPVGSIFYMPNQGMVLAGRIAHGSVAIGDRVTIVSPGRSQEDVVAGLERVGRQEFLDTAKEDEEIAILCRGVKPENIADGLERVDEIGWKVVRLTVRSVEERLGWWKRIWPRSNR